MEARELRIGNYVQNEQETIGRIISFSDSSYIMKTKFSTSSYRVTGKKPGILPIYGIPLAEEWLVKLGFENHNKEDNPTWMSIYNTVLHLVIYYNIPEKYIEIERIRINIEYVHQLQNMCYALTGEELTLTEI